MYLQLGVLAFELTGYWAPGRKREMGVIVGSWTGTCESKAEMEPKMASLNEFDG